jgi:hypothetical protein
MTAHEFRTHLAALEAERALARTTRLRGVAAYMDDLEDEIDACRAAFVGTAVTEMATLRGELFGRDAG